MSFATCGMPSWRSIICAPILAGVRYAHAASIRTARASTLSFAPVTVTTDVAASQPGPVILHLAVLSALWLSDHHIGTLRCRLGRCRNGARRESLPL